MRLCIAALGQLADGAGIVAAVNLASRPTRTTLRTDGGEDEVAPGRRVCPA